MKNLRIAIVDDDPSAAAALQAHAERLCTALGLPAQIETFSDGDLFLSQAAGKANVVFLDVEMPLMDGMSAARALRQRDPEAVIIFVTSFAQYAVRGYEVGAWRYLMKPVSYEDFAAACEKPFADFAERDARCLPVRTEEGLERIPWAQIEYIETGRNHDILIHKADGVCRANVTLSIVEAQLKDAPFFRCHASYLVNLRRVVRLEKNDALLQSGARIPVSRHRRREMTEQFMHAVREVFA